MTKPIEITLAILFGLMCLFWIGYATAGIYNNAIKEQSAIVCEDKYEDKYKSQYERLLETNKNIELENVKLQMMTKQCIAGLEDFVKKLKP